MSATRRQWLLVAATGIAGCVRRPPPERAAAAGYPGPLVDTAAMGRPFLVRQRLEAHLPGRAPPPLDVALQLATGALTLVVLGPFGTPSFIIRQQGVTVTAEKLVAQAPPIAPRDVLNDVHRVFFRSVSAGPPDGWRTAESDGERIDERREGGVVRQRRFRRIDARPPGEVAIEFSGSGPVIAPLVVLRNGWFGYELRITTQQQQWL